MDLLTLPHFYIFLCFVLWTVTVRIVSGSPIDRRFGIALLVLCGGAILGLAVAGGEDLLKVLFLYSVFSTLLLSYPNRNVLYPLSASLFFGVCLWRLSLYGDVPLFPTSYRAVVTLFAAAFIRAYLDDLGAGRQRFWAGLGVTFSLIGGAIAWNAVWEKFSPLLLLISFLGLGAHLVKIAEKDGSDEPYLGE